MTSSWDGLSEPSALSCFTCGKNGIQKSHGTCLTSPINLWQLDIHLSPYIDYALVTHMDQDHISGLMELLEKQEEPGVIQIGTLILPDTDLKDDCL